MIAIVHFYRVSKKLQMRVIRRGAPMMTPTGMAIGRDQDRSATQSAHPLSRDFDHVLFRLEDKKLNLWRNGMRYMTFVGKEAVPGVKGRVTERSQLLRVRPVAQARLDVANAEEPSHFCRRGEAGKPWQAADLASFCRETLDNK